VSKKEDFGFLPFTSTRSFRLLSVSGAGKWPGLRACGRGVDQWHIIYLCFTVLSL